MQKTKTSLLTPISKEKITSSGPVQPEWLFDRMVSVFATSQWYLLHWVKQTWEQGAAHCPRAARGTSSQASVYAACPFPGAGCALGARLGNVGITLAFTSADRRKTSVRWWRMATKTPALQHLPSSISTEEGRMAGLLLPLHKIGFNVRYLKWPKYYFTGGNIRYHHLTLLALTHSDQTTLFRNVPPHLLLYMSYNAPLYSDSSHEFSLAKIKLYVCTSTTKEVVI